MRGIVVYVVAMAFWFLIILLCLLAVVPAILVGRRNAAVSSDDQAIEKALYEARVSEIEADFELGRIDDEARQSAIAEEGRRLLRNHGCHNETSLHGRGKGASLAFVIPMLLVPVFSLAFYLSTATPPPEVVPPLVAETEEPQPTLDELIAMAEKRLQEDPDDVRGWRVIAPIYMRRGQFSRAQNAFRNLIRLDGDTPQLMQALAEAIVLGSGNQVDEEARKLFSRVREAQPENDRAGYFLGLAAMQSGDVAAAQNIWQEMLQRAKGDEPWIEAVRANLSQMQQTRQSPLELSPEQLEQVTAMVEGLATRLEEEPGQKDDWFRLVRSYIVLQRTEDAKLAFDKASEIFKDDKEFLAVLEKLITVDSGGTPPQ